MSNLQNYTYQEAIEIHLRNAFYLGDDPRHIYVNAEVYLGLKQSLGRALVEVPVWDKDQGVQVTAIVIQTRASDDKLRNVLIIPRMG